jgi:hypothetical protein
MPDVSDNEVEQAMAEWLASPLEFGVRPIRVRRKSSYTGELVTFGHVQIHLVEYQMPDGVTGRGFVNGPLTWSFIGSDIDAIDDQDLLVAYCGWAWLFSALNGPSGNVRTRFVSDGQEATFVGRKRREGWTEIEVTNRYKIAEHELFEFTGVFSGRRARGAGGLEHYVSFKQGEPCFNLPSIYFFLGPEIIVDMR